MHKKYAKMYSNLVGTAKKSLEKSRLFLCCQTRQFSRSLVSRHRSYASCSLSKCHPRHFFTSAPQKKRITQVVLSFFVPLTKPSLTR